MQVRVSLKTTKKSEHLPFNHVVIHIIHNSFCKGADLFLSCHRLNILSNTAIYVFPSPGLLLAASPRQEGSSLMEMCGRPAGHQYQYSIKKEVRRDFCKKFAPVCKYNGPHSLHLSNS